MYGTHGDLQGCSRVGLGGAWGSMGVPGKSWAHWRRPWSVPWALGASGTSLWDPRGAPTLGKITVYWYLVDEGICCWSSNTPLLSWPSEYTHMSKVLA